MRRRVAIALVAALALAGCGDDERAASPADAGGSTLRTTWADPDGAFRLIASAYRYARSRRRRTPAVGRSGGTRRTTYLRRQAMSPAPLA